MREGRNWSAKRRTLMTRSRRFASRLAAGVNMPGWPVGMAVPRAVVPKGGHEKAGRNNGNRPLRQNPNQQNSKHECARAHSSWDAAPPHRSWCSTLTFDPPGRTPRSGPSRRAWHYKDLSTARVPRSVPLWKTTQDQLSQQQKHAGHGRLFVVIRCPIALSGREAVHPMWHLGHV